MNIGDLNSTHLGLRVEINHPRFVLRGVLEQVEHWLNSYEEDTICSQEPETIYTARYTDIRVGGVGETDLNPGTEVRILP